VRRTLINLFTLVGGFVLALVLLEVALRIYNPVVQTVKGETVVVPVGYDEHRKNAFVSGVAPEVHIHQNSIGFRGGDPPGDLPDRLSIITVGGSTTRSALQADDRTWTALLGDEVADCFDRTWINNAGFDGHTSFAHIQLIQNYLNKLHPKVVLLLIGANEVYADRANATSRELVLPELNYRSGLKVFLEGVARQSEVLSLGLTFYRSLRAWQAGLNAGNSRWETMETGDPMPPGGENWVTVAHHAQAAYDDRLRLILQLLREEGTVPVLITQPTIGGTGQDPTTGKDLSRLVYGLFWYRLFEAYNDTMRQIAHREDVPLVDLAREMPKDTKYYADPMHFTDTGSALAARIVGVHLLPYLADHFPSFNRGACHFTAESAN
jgi:lysophospholipase L1-like esterase